MIAATGAGGIGPGTTSAWRRGNQAELQPPPKIEGAQLARGVIALSADEALGGLPAGALARCPWGVMRPARLGWAAPLELDQRCLGAGRRR